jgi:hypothetical protein
LQETPVSVRCQCTSRPHHRTCCVLLCRLQKQIADVSAQLEAGEAAREQLERLELKMSMHESEAQKLEGELDAESLEMMKGDDMTLAQLNEHVAEVCPCFEHLHFVVTEW